MPGRSLPPTSGRIRSHREPSAPPDMGSPPIADQSWKLKTLCHQRSSHQASV
jgi:hypothetical protein